MINRRRRGSSATRAATTGGALWSLLSAALTLTLSALGAASRVILLRRSPNKINQRQSGTTLGST